MDFFSALLSQLLGGTSGSGDVEVVEAIKLKNIANLVVDCLENVAWANTSGETKLNALKEYINSIETPDTPDEPEIDADGYETVRVINEDEISHLTGNNSTSPYYTSNSNTRESYSNFDIPIEYDYTYKLEYETNCTELVVLGFKFYNQKALDAVSNKTNISTSDANDLPAWITSGTPFSIPTETLNGSPIVCMRMTFKKNDNTAFAEGGGVTSITIKRKAGRVA